MELTPHQEAILSILIGIFLIVGGLTSKHLIDESVVTATDEQRARAKATPLGRLAVVIAGSVAILVGLYMLVH